MDYSLQQSRIRKMTLIMYIMATKYTDFKIIYYPIDTLN